ncbi:RelA/SpoT family protein [Spiroplasma endosymbiont of Aleiodes alternator]|uniref:RelA/SpoT family protein n=1 Tax=Spiroplasma endosymbiont of Aleiodes alternator TaxID=3139329 RepID=UPI003CCB17B5
MNNLTCKDFNQLLAEAKTFIKDPKQITKIKVAYEYALLKHKDQYRKNGDPYVYHVLSTAYNLVLWHLDVSSIQAGFLHDILEDTPTTFDELVAEFGLEVANLVLAVTKVSHFAKEKRNEIKANYLRKLYLSLAHDIRVIIIKMADRLHNIRTINFLNPEKQIIIAKETLEVYASIAHRLGMRKLQSELEDRSFAVLHPKEYKKIDNLINLDREKREKLVNEIIKELSKTLSQHKNLIFKIYGRSKHLYSIYRKMYYFGKDFDDIHDILAIRVVTNSIDSCYAILGYIHQSFTPVPGRFKDYIATPKNNMYQSLHTSVVFDNEIYELQIRTEEMEDFAEAGAASHWRYKEGEKKNPKKRQAEIDEKLNIFQEILNLNDLNPNVDENILADNIVKDNNLEKEIRQDIFSDLIYVLTPNGNVITLPFGSTVLDFAFKVHTEIGETTVGARINGIYSPINTVLKSGDIVEIKTAKTARPSRDWLNIVKTNFAQHKIKKYLNNQQEKFNQENKIKDTENKEKIKKTKEKIEEYIIENHIRWKIAKRNVIMSRIRSLKYKTYEDFCLDVANGTYTIEQAVTTILYSDSATFQELKTKQQTTMNLSSNNEIIIENAPNTKTSLAHCCLPIPDEPIAGYITKGQGIKVHRLICPNVSLPERKERIIDTKWNLLATSYHIYNSKIQIQYLDRPALMTDVLNILGYLKAQIQSIDANNKLKENHGSLKILIKVSNIERLHQIISSIKKIPDIIAINRIIM